MYGKLANTFVRLKNLDRSIQSNVSIVYDTMMSIKKEFADWKDKLPSYYEAIILPTHYLEFEDTAIMTGYPYGPRLEYVATVIGHTMNLYRAGNIAIDIFLSEYLFQSSSVTEASLRMAHEIVMSMPSLYKIGGVLLTYPGRQAARVLGREYREYIAMVLTMIASVSISAAKPALLVRASTETYKMTCEDYEILRESTNEMEFFR